MKPLRNGDCRPFDEVGFFSKHPLEAVASVEQSRAGSGKYANSRNPPARRTEEHIADMIELFGLIEKVYRTIATDLVRWFSYVPPGGAWYIISDYCVGDPTKANDSFAFAIILNHDTHANIAEYITNVAPSDIKATRTASDGLISYLNSPVAFSVTYVVERGSKLLRDYITDANMAEFIPDARRFLQELKLGSPLAAPYFDSVDRRFEAFQLDIRRKNFNAKLGRQMLLTSAFAAVLFRCLDLSKAPSYIKRISDRDAVTDRYDGLTYDLSYLFFLLLRSTDRGGPAPDRPKFLFAHPGMDGETEYAELIRIPDYLAGTFADLDIVGASFTHDKFRPIFTEAIVNSRNNCVVQLIGSPEGTTARRIAYSNGLSARPSFEEDWA